LRERRGHLGDEPVSKGVSMRLVGHGEQVGVGVFGDDLGLVADRVG
jgi:hypothetical protein